MATVSLEWSDALFWPNAADDSIYLHRLAVRRAHAGQEVGKRLLYWAGPQTAAAGRKYLRLDCMAENPALCHYYLMCGFYFWGEVSVRSFKSALWEKEIR
jgi:GNAT superfamily N-acetyltransferase